jgi:hypothetical protein
VGSVSSSGRHDGGISRGHLRLVSPPRSPSTEEDLYGANEAKIEKLRSNDVQRRARTRGLELRHSAYGYALIDSARRPVDDRDDLSLAVIVRRAATGRVARPARRDRFACGRA